MNTQTHVIMGALITGKSVPKLAWAGALGGILPDLPMYGIILGLRLQGYDLETIFGQIYWENWWQIANGIGHNIPLWSTIALLSAWMLKREGTLQNAFTKFSKASWAFALSLSATIHSVIDFLCHRDDAHMQFWPFTEWRFRSPVSYWDPNHYGQYFSIFEAGLGLLMAVILFKRYQNKLMKIALGMAALAYIAVPAFFYIFHHGA